MNGERWRTAAVLPLLGFVATVVAANWAMRTRELVGFQRWIIGAYDKRVPWAAWEAAGYSPRRLHVDDVGQMDLA